MEIWKDVKGYEGLYEVSNLGNIKSCERVVEYIKNSTGKACYHKICEKIKKPSIKKNGYLQIQLYKNNKCANKYIHRIVAEAFIDNPLQKETVNHKDLNKKNNSADNLEWATSKEQMEHLKNVGIKRLSKHKGIIVEFKNGYTETFSSISECSMALKIARDTIYSIMKNNKSSKAIELNISAIMPVIKR